VDTEAAELSLPDLAAQLSLAVFLLPSTYSLSSVDHSSVETALALPAMSSIGTPALATPPLLLCRSLPTRAESLCAYLLSSADTAFKQCNSLWMLKLSLLIRRVGCGRQGPRVCD